MQKKLIALAVAGLASGGAFAQSNVTIYGVLDASAYYNHQPHAGTTYGFASNNVASSRIGFKGTEDLGNGLKANFVLEEELNLASGATGSTSSGSNATGNNNFNRAANVGLSGSFGSLVLGRQATPTYAAVGASDAFGANSGGFVNAWVRSNLTNANVITGLTSTTTNSDGGVILPGSYAAGIGYATPIFSNFQVKLFVNAGNGVTGTSYSNNGIRDIAFLFDDGTFAARYTHQEIKNTVAIGASNITESKGDLLAGSVKAFGTWKFSGAWSKTKYDASLTTNDDTTVWSLGATDQINPTTRLGVSYTIAKDDDVSTNKAKTLSFLADYTLSPRTAVYALLASVKNEGLAKLNGLYGGNSVSTATGYDARNGTTNGLALGVRHSF
jgi:predicted porin